METRANYIAVGIMTLVALVAAFLFIFWIGNYNDSRDTAEMDIRIRGSVSGLGVGSAVQFNGITVGRVIALQLDAQDPRIVVARAAIRPDVPVRKDTRASIGIRGLSGGAFIQLEGGTPNAPALFASNSTTVPTINGDPSTISELMNRVNAIAARTERVMDGLETLVDENKSSVTQTIKNAEIFSKALADNSDGVDRFLSSAEGMAKSIEGLSGKLDGSLARAEKILAAIDPATVKKTVEDISASAASARSIMDGVDQESVRNLITEMGVASKKVTTLLAAVDAEKINKAMDSFAAAADGAKKVVEDASKFTGKISGRADDIDQLITDASQLASRLNASSGKIDEVLNAFSKLLGSGETSGLFADARATLKEFRRTARNLNNQISSVAANINKFTGRGLSDTQGLISDARQSLRRIDRVIRKIENNPAGLLTGSGQSSIKETRQGRVRR